MAADERAIDGGGPTGTNRAPIVRVENLAVQYKTRSGTVHAVNDVSFDIAVGETLGLVGESGSGKSTIGRCIVRLTTPARGRIVFQGTDLAALNDRALLSYRARLQMVFQDPFDSMNPRMTVEETLRESLVLQGAPHDHQLRRVREVLDLVVLNEKHLPRYRHELSGGQLQRVALARALTTVPEFLVLDEPTSSLDASLRREILDLLIDLQRRLHVSCLFISHDLNTVRRVSQRTAVLYLGEIVEVGITEELFRSPKHPYTKALLSAVLPLLPSAKRGSYFLRGDIPSPLSLPSGCFLHPRCPEAIARCSNDHPALSNVVNSTGRKIRCLLVTDAVDRIPQAIRNATFKTRMLAAFRRAATHLGNVFRAYRTS
jgi:oligopeptide/dipeptide ABC transporter ATP-binding protein